MNRGQSIEEDGEDPPCTGRKGESDRGADDNEQQALAQSIQISRRRDAPSASLIPNSWRRKTTLYAVTPYIPIDASSNPITPTAPATVASTRCGARPSATE